jgi:hypothetical protein
MKMIYDLRLTIDERAGLVGGVSGIVAPGFIILPP